MSESIQHDAGWNSSAGLPCSAGNACGKLAQSASANPRRAATRTTAVNCREPNRLTGITLVVALALLGAACASGPPPLKAIDRRVDLERFMGDWYVVASIPLFIEADAHDAVESYRLTPDGVIETTYTFRDGSFDGPLRRFEPNARVEDPATNATWGMQFIWPFRATYLIVDLDEDYRHTIIGVPSRRWVWLMSREPQVDPAEYARMVSVVSAAGYDVSRLRRVPHRPR